MNVMLELTDEERAGSDINEGTTSMGLFYFLFLRLDGSAVSLHKITGQNRARICKRLWSPRIDSKE